MDARERACAGTHNHRLWNMVPRYGVPATQSASQTRVNTLLLVAGCPSRGRQSVLLKGASVLQPAAAI